MLLLAGLSLAAPSVAALGVHGGLDVGWLVGGNGAGYRSGFGERLAVGYSLTSTTEILLALDHAHYILDDASAYFVDPATPPEALGGGRDVIGLGAGLRVRFDLGGAPSTTAGRIRTSPYARFEAGMAYTRTAVQAAGFDGMVLIRSGSTLPRLTISLGAEVRTGARVSVLPHLDTTAVIAADESEVGAVPTWGAEVRVAPGIDVRVGF